MELQFSNGTITLDKELNALDSFAIDFTSILDHVGIRYVIISGYAAILFGRNRASEDIDMFIEPIDFPKFESLWKELSTHFECVITTKPETAYETYLNQSTQSVSREKISSSPTWN